MADLPVLPHGVDERDNLALFLNLLLDLMPLHRITRVRSERDLSLRLPKSATPCGFHRSYASTFHAMLGGFDVPWWRYREVTIVFLTQKIPPTGLNHFKWRDFSMTHDEIVEVATQASNQYAMQRFGYVPGMPD